jgi:hypothetical protein
MCVSGAKSGVLYSPLWDVVTQVATSERVQVKTKSTR